MFRTLSAALCAAALLSTATSAASVAPGDTAQRVHGVLAACAAVADDHSRLFCFDMLAGAVATAQAADR